MKIKIVARETIKPSSSTPKCFDLSIMDQLAHPVYTKLYFFYENTSSEDIEKISTKRSLCLKASLSQVLNIFYPIAGRNIRDQMTVSLEEDDGVEFLEARVDSNLSKYLEKPNHEIFLHLVPDDFWDTLRRPRLIVQASFFSCGGLAIGVNISHKVSDACSFTLFMSAWANTTFGKTDKVINPDLSVSLAFPAVKQVFVSGEDIGKVVKVNDKTKRFVFNETNIAALQQKGTNKSMKRVTRIEAVSTFIWRIGMKMLMKRAGCSRVPSVLIMPVNLRKWLKPLICEQSFGNLVEFQIVPNNICDIELPYLISLLKEQMKRSRDALAKNLDGKQFTERCLEINKKMVEMIMQNDDFFVISSWSKFPLYETDFGWGKPRWVATHNPFPYLTHLLDTRDGKGIEAWVNFPEEKMAIFSCDEELLTYATSDPTAL